MSWTKKWALRAVAHCGQGCPTRGREKQSRPHFIFNVKIIKELLLRR